MVAPRLFPCVCLSLLLAVAIGRTTAQDFVCPTTASSSPPQFFAPAPYSLHAPFQDHFWYGTEALWTVLREDGRWGGLHRPAQDLYGNKVFMWRQGYDWRTEQKPALTLTARRLDQDAAAVVVRHATNASGEDIGSAMLTGANVPVGCWEFTAHYNRHSLTFVVSVP